MEAAANLAPAVTRADFEDALVKFVVCNKLPISVVEDPTFKTLVNISYLAQSEEVTQIPKKDVFTLKIKKQYDRYYEMVKQELVNVPKL
ncbi:hypothetical protein BGZ74_006024, partial [Mortierella antarctica]